MVEKKETIKAKVQEVLTDIYKRDGEVRPSTLIEAARPKSSPVHDAFEWDNRKAGDEYRLMQARAWIRRVHIVIEGRQERFVHVPVVKVDRIIQEVETSSVESETVYDNETFEGYYRPLSVVANDADDYKLALDSTAAKLKGAKAAYDELKRAAVKAKDRKLPDFKRADRGFGMVEKALDVNG